MTDRETLFTFRLKQAEETLADARTMLAGGVSTRSVVNRAYYVMFYSILALFIAEKTDHKTSKHAGIISLFDRMIVHPGKLGREYSRMLHRLFDARQESDYKEFTQLSAEDAADCVRVAEEFLMAVKGLIQKGATE